MLPVVQASGLATNGHRVEELERFSREGPARTSVATAERWFAGGARCKHSTKEIVNMMALNLKFHSGMIVQLKDVGLVHADTTCTKFEPPGLPPNLSSPDKPLSQVNA